MKTVSVPPRCTATQPTTSSSSSSSASPSHSTHSRGGKAGRKRPVVAIVGRPNVGKSTLVNRLAGTFRSGSIVADVVGVTRDRTYRRSDWNGASFSLVDTGGLVFDDQSTYLPEIRAQALIAIREASVVVLVVDGMAGVNALDLDLARFLRREVVAGKKKIKKGGFDTKVLVAVNKCESVDSGRLQAADFWALGLGEPYPVSAIHGSGTGDLLDDIVNAFPHQNVVDYDYDDDDGIINVAIVGRPNVGKSSLLNMLAGEQRAIVSSEPGTTRDAVDEEIVRTVPFTDDDETLNIDKDGNEEHVELDDKGRRIRRYRLIDTAGIRRKGSVEFGTEFFMINRSFRAIRRADVVLLLLDVTESSEQDRKIADRVRDEGKACIVVANKWDLIPSKTNRSYNTTLDDVRARAVAVSFAPVELVSVLTGQRVSRLLDMADSAVKEHRRRVSTATLNDVLRDAVEWHRPPASRQGKQGKLYYCTQVGVKPPTIAVFVNDPRLFSDNYRRYMEGQFRKALGFVGTPLRLVWRGKARAPVV